MNDSLRINDLPADLQRRIASFCDIPTQDALVLTCRSLQQAVTQERLDWVAACAKRPRRFTSEALPLRLELAARGCPRPHMASVLAACGKAAPPPERGPLWAFNEKVVAYQEDVACGRVFEGLIGSDDDFGWYRGQRNADNTLHGLGVFTSDDATFSFFAWNHGAREKPGLTLIQGSDGTIYEGEDGGPGLVVAGVTATPDGRWTEGLWQDTSLVEGETSHRPVAPIALATPRDPKAWAKVALVEDLDILDGW